MVMEPVVVVAVMWCGDAGLRVTLTRVLPTVERASMAYATFPGRRSDTEPTVAVAVAVSGGAENVTSILPADRLRVTWPDDTSRPRIDPAWLVTSTGPD